LPSKQSDRRWDGCKDRPEAEVSERCDGAGADQEKSGQHLTTDSPGVKHSHPHISPPLFLKNRSGDRTQARHRHMAGVAWGLTPGQGGPVQPWMLVTPVWAAEKTLHTNGWPRTSGNVQAPPASPTPSRACSAAQAAPHNIHGGQKPPGGDEMVGDRLVGGEELVGKASKLRNTGADASEAVARLLEENRQRLENLDEALRERLPQPKTTGRRRRIYPSPYMAAAVVLYEAGYSVEDVAEAVNRAVGEQHAINEETLRHRLVELGVKIRQKQTAVREATLRGPRAPPKDTVQMAAAAALVQGDAALRVKGRTMLEIILNTPDEGFARNIARLFEGHGTISLGARKYTEEYYEWQLIIRLDLEDWRFLLEAKQANAVPSFIKTEEEFAAYLAMMLACEGYITWGPLNEEKTEKPTTGFYVCPITNTNEGLLDDIEKRLTAAGYKVSRTRHTPAGHMHIDNYGRSFVSTKDCFRLLIYRREDVERLLPWLGKIPCPIKEAYRVWSLRILDKHTYEPIDWSEVQWIKDHLQHCDDMAKENGRKRAKEHFFNVQHEMDSGLRRDTRPYGAQTAPFT